MTTRENRRRRHRRHKQASARRSRNRITRRACGFPITDETLDILTIALRHDEAKRYSRLRNRVSPIVAILSQRNPILESLAWTVVPADTVAVFP